MHAAATLATLGERSEFGNAYPDVVSIVTAALESLETMETETEHSHSQGGDGESALADLRYKPQLGAQLAATLLRVLAMGTAEDAGSVRDTLLKKRDVIRGAVDAATAALESFPRGDDGGSFPEDPFGTRGTRELGGRDTTTPRCAARVPPDRSGRRAWTCRRWRGRCRRGRAAARTTRTTRTTRTGRRVSDARI